MFNFSNFFLEKNKFLGKKNIDIFENSIHFLILCILWKNETSLPSGGPSPPPRTPCGGRVIAFKWPGRSPPRKNPGDATGLSLPHSHFSLFILLNKEWLVFKFESDEWDSTAVKIAFPGKEIILRPEIPDLRH